MKQIMKAQLYQLRKNRILWLIFFVICIMQITGPSGEMCYYEEMMAGSKYIADFGYTILHVAVVFVLLLTAEICGGDFMDKTKHYELMGGYTRKKIYLSRFWLSFLLSCLFMIVISMIAVITALVLGGWGDELSVGWCLVRLALVMFPVFRLICEFVFLSYVVKNSYVVMGAGTLVFFVGMFGNNLISEKARFFSGLGTLYELTDFHPWSTFTLVGEKMITLYDASMNVSQIAGVIGSSLIFGLLFLWLGYRVFLKDDIN